MVAIGWQLLMTVLGIVLEYRFTDLDPNSLTPLSHMLHWDGGWYYTIIAENGYSNNPSAPVFYPLFPLAVSALQTLSVHLLSLTAATLVVNTAALWLAIVALVRITEHFNAGRYKWLVVALFLASPVALFLHFVYAEALFCALAFWAYLFALRRQWWYMAIALSLLLLVKIPALLVIALCGLEFMRTYSWSPKKMFNRYAWSFAIVPLGFMAYGWYLHHIRHDFFAMFHGYDLTTDWAYHVFNPNFLIPIINAAKTVVLAATGQAADYPGFVFIGALLPLAALTALAVTSLYAILAIKGKGVPLGIAGLLAIPFFTINSNVISVHRYVLPFVALYLVPVLCIQKYPRWRPLMFVAIAFGLLVQTILYIFFVSGRFAG